MTNNIASKISSINSRLVNDLKAKVQSDWLSECVEYFLSQQPQINFNELYENVLNQLCLANIQDSSHRVIPDTFTTKKDAWSFNNSMLLQMQKIIDISEPPYEQWRRLHNKKLDEVIEDSRESRTFQSKKKRMFKLELTDGYKTVVAMEMKHIPSLNTKLSPGVKILINGPVQVVNHIIMLKPENIKIIGGEVEELLIENAYENVLLKLLNKPITNTPITNYTESTVEEEKPQCIPKNLVQMPNQFQQRRAEPEMMDDIDDDFDLAMIEAIEEQVLKNSSQEEKSNEPVTNSSIMMDDDNFIFDDLDLEENGQQEILRQIESMEVTIEENEPQHVVKPNELLNIPQNYISESTSNIIRKRKSIDCPDLGTKVVKSMRLSPIRMPQIIDNDYPYKIENKYNFITIDQYVGLRMRDKMEREYAIEARVEKVHKIKATENGWFLSCQIKDPYSQSTLSVRFLDEIVTGIGQRTAKEMILLKIQMDQGQPQLKMDMTNTLCMINDGIQSNSMLLCIQMHAKLPADYENIVTRILEKTDEALKIITSKIEMEKIPLA